MDTRDLTDEMHEEFYRYISHNPDKPRFKLHYKTDAPLDIKALFYVPEVKPSECHSAATELMSSSFIRIIFVWEKRDDSSDFAHERFA